MCSTRVARTCPRYDERHGAGVFLTLKECSTREERETETDARNRDCEQPRLTRVALFKFQQAELQEKLAKMYNVSDEKCVSIFGFRTAFGGGKSTGFGLIYDNIEAFKKFEPKHRLIRAGLKDAVQKSRKNIKEKKNRVKKLRGGAKNKVM